jgi:hypothetical protein
MTTKTESLANIDCTESRVIANNTFEYFREDGTRVIRLHTTDIMEFRPDGTIKLNSGGWRTVTTKERMNRYLPCGRIYQDKGIWYYSGGRLEQAIVAYSDGMVIDAKTGKPIDYDPDEIDRIKRILKQINHFCKEMDKLEELPEPSQGDCWGCLMFQTTDCLQSHLDEVYIHGSLIVRAMKDQGHSDAYLNWLWNPEYRDHSWSELARQTAIRAVRRYFKRYLGVGS